MCRSIEETLSRQVEDKRSFFYRQKTYTATQVLLPTWAGTSMEEGALWHHPQQWAPSLCKSISWCSAPQRQDLLLLLLALLPRGVPHLHHWEPDRAEEGISRPPCSHWPSSRTFFTIHNSLNYEGHDTVDEDPGAPSNLVFRSTICKLQTNFFVGYLDKMVNILPPPPPFSENTSLLQA